ncbi:MAG: lytic transglycosylase [Haliea sp.]|nr:lytic transglycosylase [Haliea sp.]
MEGRVLTKYGYFNALRKLVIVVSGVLLLSGCSHLGSLGEREETTAATDEALHPYTPTVTRKAPVRLQTVPVREDDVWARIRNGLSWEAPDNPAMQEALNYYLNQERFLESINGRAALYLHYIVEQVEERDMPLELALLPIVESSLNPVARSRQQALGLWQIMPATGEYLGLDSDWWYDGRRDVRASTHAALDYLQNLYEAVDGDWTLAIAAYNAGIGRVTRAVQRNAEARRPTDYWSLRLPAETHKYVPRLLALSMLIADPEGWGVALPAVANSPAFAAVPTGGQIELARAAELADVPLATLKALNPGHLRWATAPSVNELLLPPAAAEQFRQQLATLPAQERVSWQRHQVRNGETLSHIARRYDTSVAMLQQVNGLRGHMIRAGSQLMIPRGGDWQGSLAQRESAPQAQGYRVRRGDSLYRIAGRFKVSVEELLAWNALNPGEPIYPGQRLTVYPGGG